MRYDKLSVSLHAVVDDVDNLREEWERTDGRDRGIEVLGITGFTYEGDDPEREAGERTFNVLSSIDALLNRSELTGALDVEASQQVGAGAARVFIRCADEANLDHLQELGISIDLDTGRSRPATVPFRAFDALTEDERVEAVVASARTHPHLDLAQTDLAVPAFVKRSGATGSGVVIGIVDTGIDANHPAFAGRILRVWDQTLRGTGVPEGAYGVEGVGSAPPGSADEAGHGTHVAGIAAGNDTAFPGIAPDARLVIVKTDFDSSRVAAGVRYIFRVAEQEGMPAVVNLSLGTHNNAHDGTDALSVAVTGQLQAGQIVCASAGNEGDDEMHALASVAPPMTASLLIGVDPRAPRYVWCNLWHDGSEELELSVTTPAGNSTPWQGTITYGKGARTHPLPDGVVQITTPPATSNGQNAMIELRPKSGYATVGFGAWEVRIRSTRGGSADVHAWLMDHQPFHVGPSKFLAGGVNDTKVGAPAVADQVIAVAASVTRDQWTNEAGADCCFTQPVGGIADFSSPGPSRDGRRKPDVAAPGAMIISSRSASLTGLADQVIDAEHLAMAGTSMSCPMVTGLIALWLEANPTLTPAQAKADLIAAARIPGQPAGIWDARWGHGAVSL